MFVVLLVKLYMFPVSLRYLGIILIENVDFYRVKGSREESEVAGFFVFSQ